MVRWCACIYTEQHAYGTHNGSCGPVPLLWMRLRTECYFIADLAGFICRLSPFLHSQSNAAPYARLILNRFVCIPFSFTTNIYAWMYFSYTILVRKRQSLRIPNAMPCYKPILLAFYYLTIIFIIIIISITIMSSKVQTHFMCAPQSGKIDRSQRKLKRYIKIIHKLCTFCYRAVAILSFTFHNIPENIHAQSRMRFVFALVFFFFLKTICCVMLVSMSSV